MKFRLARSLAIVSLCSIASGAAGYLYGVRSTEPHLTVVTTTACGVPASTSSFAIPMQLLTATIPARPVTIGPVEVPGVVNSVSLRFDPTIDGRSTEVRQVENTIHLPLIFGRAAAHPNRIRLICRDGRVATVRYRLDVREQTTFRVIDSAPESGRRVR
ncbi:hypothetical protein [Rhodospirillaceae bacterium SYSU D60014]|uniref:hypothetical protein n=1 Tax=Virgifigura deserti TaxID=2268457 RepID=UPI0013C51735